MFYLYTNIDKKYYKKIVPEQVLELIKNEKVKEISTGPNINTWQERFYNRGDPKKYVYQEITSVSFNIELHNDEEYSILIQNYSTSIKKYKYSKTKEENGWVSKPIIKEKELPEIEDLKLTDEYLEWYWNTLKEIEEKQGLKGFTREEYQGRCVTLYEGRDY